jgi:hypothetical protein
MRSLFRRIRLALAGALFTASTVMDHAARWLAGMTLRQQIGQDTCKTHGVFCCEKCFDMRPVGEPIELSWPIASSEDYDDLSNVMQSLLEEMSDEELIEAVRQVQEPVKQPAWQAEDQFSRERWEDDGGFAGF